MKLDKIHEYRVELMQYLERDGEWFYLRLLGAASPMETVPVSREVAAKVAEMRKCGEVTVGLYLEDE